MLKKIEDMVNEAGIVILSRMTPGYSEKIRIRFGML